jgi:hypothetical protein
MIEFLTKEISNTRHLEVNNNVLVNKQYEELINFENFLNSNINMIKIKRNLRAKKIGIL